MLDDNNPLMFVALSDVIVVTFNYRIDIFGFLHLKDNENEQIDGNAGLLDQFLVLKWINQNCDSFSGDPNKVTIMGHGAGALSVGYHLMFSLSWPYFRNAIILSGSPVSVTRTLLSSSQATNRTKFFLKEIMPSCPQKKLIECARNLDSKNLTLFSKIFFDKKIVGTNLFSSSYLKSAFLPTVDNIFFSETPIRAFRTENFKSCNILTGFTSNENSVKIPLTYGEISTESNGKKNQIINFKSLVDFLQSYYSFFPTWPIRIDETFLNSILNEYTKLTSYNYQQKSSRHLLRKNYFRTLSKILSDESYICPTFKLIEYLSQKNTSNIYLYAFNYRSTSARLPEHYGVYHGKELEMIFGHPLISQKLKFLGANSFKRVNFTDQDKQFSRNIIKRWSNFIYDNDPNSNLADEKDFWPKFYLPSVMPEINADNQPLTNTNDSLNYMAFRSNGNKVNRATNLDSCYLWNNLIPANLEVLGKRILN